jgi:adenine phosphoribosyltransferase
LEIQRDALKPGERVLLLDDVLATGGTLAAAAALVGQAGAELVGAGVVIELVALGGRSRWSADLPLYSVLRY